MHISDEHSNEIHRWATAAAAIAAVLPVGLDAVALGAEEIAMVIRIGSLFGGVSIEESQAQGILAAGIAESVGVAAHTAAYSAMESANIGYPFTIPLKMGIAMGLVEIVGRAAYAYFQDKSKQKSEQS